MSGDMSVHYIHSELLKYGFACYNESALIKLVYKVRA